MIDSTIRVGCWLLAPMLAAAAGCSANDEPDWQYGRADMEAAVFGTWTGTYTPEGGTAVPLALEIRASDEPARSLSCGSRSFAHTEGTPGLALRCSEASTLALSGTLSFEGGSKYEALEGSFSVYSTEFYGGSLGLGYVNSADVRLDAELSDGAWSVCRMFRAPGPIGSCTLDARAE
jgi:hypothetical protein